jgi:hypothetical protein
LKAHSKLGKSPRKKKVFGEPLNTKKRSNPAAYRYFEGNHYVEQQFRIALP